MTFTATVPPITGTQSEQIQSQQSRAGVEASPSCSHTTTASRSGSPAHAHTDTNEGTIHHAHNPGYVGVTSYSNIFSEGFADLAEDPVDEHNCKQQQSVTDKNMPRSCEVLSFLQNRALVDDFIHMFHELEEDGGLIGKPVLETWRQGVWDTHGDVLHRQDPTELRVLARLLWDNSHKLRPITKDMTTRQWAEADTGMGVRWTTVGLIAAMVGLGAQQILDTHHLYRKHSIDRKVLLAQMSEVMSTCLDFYRQCNMIDVRLAWLVLAMSLMPNKKKGNFSYTSYRESSELNDIVITLGLHQPQRGDIPIFHSELRKRTFLCAYSREIATATFLGRPPRLSHRYCMVDAPLDLSAEELFLDPPELAKIVANLDSCGFNKEGVFRRSAYERAWIAFSTAREDILDLALGRYTAEETIAAAARIERHMRDTWASYPEHISRVCTGHFPVLLPRSSGGKGELTPIQILLQFGARQGTRSTELLLQLVLIRKVNSCRKNAGNDASANIPEIKPDSMIRAATDLLSGCLEMAQNKTLTHHFPLEAHIFLGNQGMRAAAILGVELLKQEQRLQMMQLQGISPTGPPLIPRSRTIQDLAVFAARLEEVEPNDGMAAICLQGRKVIGRILDKLLTQEFSLAGMPAARKEASGLPSSTNQQQQYRRQQQERQQQQQQTTQGDRQQSQPHQQDQQQPQKRGPAAQLPEAETNQSTHIHPSLLGVSSTYPLLAHDSISGAAPSPLATLADVATISASEFTPDLTPSNSATTGSGSGGGLGEGGDDRLMGDATTLGFGLDTSTKPQDIDLWNFVYGMTEAPFLGYDHDFMAWLENMDFDAAV